MEGKLKKLARARELRRNQTDAERKLWYLLQNRKLGGLKFRRQMPVGCYYADFLCAERWLIVEVDGGQHNGDERTRDEARTKELNRIGYQVIRFWNHEVLQNLDGVGEAIMHAAATSMRRPPHPTSPPVGGRGVTE
ncbi:MAG: endonuclease domain-containing protein [Alphaproteobacteria bacterium]|jgi:very-short-patch-repair endonuclease|nr:endonuclease domain-containing protein [Alphaproteobacteria bacterium]